VVRVPRFGAKTSEVLENVVAGIPIGKVDLVHVQHEYGIFQGFDGRFYAALRQIGKPIVTTMHAVGNWVIDSLIADVSNRVIVHNEFCASRFGFPKKTVIIPHGVVLSKCDSKEEARQKLGLPVNAPIIGYCGFISSYKGLEMLIEAMTTVPNVALLIAGGWHVEQETQYIVQLKQRTLDVLPGRCQWLGYIPDEQLSTVYGAMDVVVYPSRFSTESGALLMALGHGKAVIASDLSPFKEKERKGALITFKNVADLRHKISGLLANEELRQKLEEGAREYSESVSWQNIAVQHIQLYEKILK